jgi:hypothetical protein
MTTATFADRSDAALAAWLESSAYALGRTIAYVITAAVITYECGYALGRIVHSINDRLAEASHDPVAAATAAADAILAMAEPTLTRSPAMAALLAGGAILLTDEQLARECETSRKREPKITVRRKPVKARKAPAGVA